MTTAQLESARSMTPGAFERNAPPHRHTSATAAVATKPDPGATTVQAPYVITASPQPTTWAAGSAAVLGDVALVVLVLFTLLLVPVLAIKGIAAAAGLLMGALRGNG
jgi:hypothetical protein